jgi:flavin reductase (DIM6/NTAB) family NADH-FMN oxidoreductase RutF
VARVQHVAVHLLAEDQQSLAEIFATSGIERFAGSTAWRPGPYGVPILDGTLAWLVCRINRKMTAGDHAVVFAEPLLGRLSGRGSPLLHHDGRYTRLPDPQENVHGS